MNFAQSLTSTMVKTSVLPERGEKMFCKKCGAAVSGKYCSRCGSRVFSDSEEFFRKLRTEKHRFMKSNKDSVAYWLSEVCWFAAQEKFVEPLRNRILQSDGQLDTDCLLEHTKEEAKFLFNQLYSVMENWRDGSVAKYR